MERGPMNFMRKLTTPDIPINTWKIAPNKIAPCSCNQQILWYRTSLTLSPQTIQKWRHLSHFPLPVFIFDLHVRIRKRFVTTILKENVGRSINLQTIMLSQCSKLTWDQTPEELNRSILSRLAAKAAKVKDIPCISGSLKAIKTRGLCIKNDNPANRKTTWLQKSLEDK